MSADREVEEFFTKHCAHPGGVVMAIAVQGGAPDEFALFSSLAKARVWAQRFNETENAGVVFTPYIVDEPDYGNDTTKN